MTPPAGAGASTSIVEIARSMGDEVLFPAALTTDTAPRVPESILAALAGAGLYGLAGSVRYGGAGVGADMATVGAVVEALASGCLSTTLVWAQHHSLVRALMTRGVPAGLRSEWLAPLCRGEVRAGVALAGLLPVPTGASGRTSRLQAESVSGGGWQLHGMSPWVSGWGMIDILHVAARGPDDTVVWLIVDAAAGDALSAVRHPLVAVDASCTVELHFDGLVIPSERTVSVEAFSEGTYSGADRLRFNGFFALGLADRCRRLMGDQALIGDIDHCRAQLLAAGDERIAEARAAASHLALQAATALVVHTGSGSLRRDSHAQRLAREALFLLVFATRPPISVALIDRLSQAAVTE